MEPLAKRVIRLREAKGWKQKDLIRASGVAQSTVASIENGDRSKAPSSIVEIAHALGVDAYYLKTGKAQRTETAICQKMKKRYWRRFHCLTMTAKICGLQWREKNSPGLRLASKMQRDFNDGLAQREVMTNSIYALGSNSRTALICGVLSALLSGCALPSPAMFEPGSDESKFDRDHYECERDARMIRGSDCDQMNMFESCMRSKGYKEIKGSAMKGMC